MQVRVDIYVSTMSVYIHMYYELCGVSTQGTISCFCIRSTYE